MANTNTNNSLSWDFVDITAENGIEMSGALRPKLIGAIDAGTNTIGFAIYKPPEFEELCSHKISVTQISPQEGWLEQNPLEILEAIRLCAAEACVQIEKLGYKTRDIVTIGVTNQREAVVVWDKYTGEPLYNVLEWNDIRTNVTVDKILAKLPDQNKNHFKAISGLPISPYFSALKIRWLKDNVASVRKSCRERRCLAGTLDSWIVWNLTGGTNGGIHITDVTNASRTLLMNLDTLNWDPILTKAFSIHPSMLPEIRSSSEIYGQVNDGSILNGINISAILGNQQASLVGQMCFKAGQAKSTYRSGCFLLCNTGHTRVISTHGLVTTIAYKLGKDAPPVYALEGSVLVAGSALNWLKKNLGIMCAEESELMASTVNSTGDVYFVPAFTGLYAPYWRKDARGIICGLTQFTTKNHIIRAALEAICFQTRDILEAMNQDCEFTLTKVNADGKMTSNNLLMQLQADLTGIPVLRSQISDSAVLGIAMCAAQADGINAVDLQPEKRYYAHAKYDTFLPTTTEQERDTRYTKWKKAVQRSLGWAVSTKSNDMTDERFRLLSSFPASWFIMGLFAMLVHAKSKMA